MAAARIADSHYDWQSCVSDCMGGYDSVANAGCEAPWIDYSTCDATAAPAAENWARSEAGQATFPRPIVCDPQLETALTCLSRTR